MKGFASQYVRIPRALAIDGRIRELWQMGGRGAIRLLPVLAILASGYGGEPFGVQRQQVADLSGLSSRRLAKALDLLADAEIIEVMRSVSPAVLMLRATNPAVAPDTDPAFFFSGRWLTSGLWHRLSDTLCALLLVLGSIAPAMVVHPDSHFSYQGGSCEDESWVADIQERYYVCEEGNYFEGDFPQVNRVCFTTLRQLASLTGTSRCQVCRDLAVLRSIGKGLIVEQLSTESGIWLHLPPLFWDFGGLS